MKLIPVLALTAGLFSAAVAADTVYVGGTLHTLSKSDFVQSGNNYTAYIDVIGDYGQQLVFDVDAVVGGQGFQEVTYTSETFCVAWIDGSGQLIISPDGEDECVQYYTHETAHYSNDFRYVAEMQVTCNGIAIGSDLDHKNALVNGKVTDKYREVKLLVGKQRSTGGDCQQLKVQVKGLDLESISNITMDVLIGETF